MRPRVRAGMWLLRLTCGVAAATLSIDTVWSQTAPRSTSPQSAGASGAALNPDLTRRLWESRIAIPDPNEDADEKADLKNLIEKVRALKFEDNQVTPAFSSHADEPPRTEPNRSRRVTEAQPGPTMPPVAMTTEVGLSGPVRPAPLENLGGLLQDPERVRNPLEVAELLFLSGHPVEATPYYEKALARTARDDAATRTDRAWILFQLGNCLRQTDMARARDMYMKLVSESPDSPWTELAKAHGRLITWYLAAKPEQLMPPKTSE